MFNFFVWFLGSNEGTPISAQGFIYTHWIITTIIFIILIEIMFNHLLKREFFKESEFKKPYTKPSIFFMKVLSFMFVIMGLITLGTVIFVVQLFVPLMLWIIKNIKIIGIVIGSTVVVYLYLWANQKWANSKLKKRIYKKRR